jgi:hypothetical protein
VSPLFLDIVELNTNYVGRREYTNGSPPNGMKTLSMDERYYTYSFHHKRLWTQHMTLDRCLIEC